jgi:hypothetical protein
VTARANRQTEIHVNFETKRMTLAFADKVALDLDMSKHAPLPEEEELRRQLTVTRQGALAFFSWASTLLYATSTPPARPSSMCLSRSSGGGFRRGAGTTETAPLAPATARMSR